MLGHSGRAPADDEDAECMKLAGSCWKKKRQEIPAKTISLKESEYLNERNTKKAKKAFIIL